MAILLVPGFMADHSLWDGVAGALGEFGPIAIADLSQDSSIEAMARRALSAAPPKFVLVGFSMGGYVAREIARLAANRVGALVLVATSARGDTPEQARRKAIAAAQVTTGQFKGLSRSSILNALHPNRSNDADLIERIRAMGDRLGPETFLRQSSIRREGDLDKLPQIACPTLVIAASHDRVRSLEEATELSRGIPSASLQTIPDSGHMVPLEAPGPLAQAIASWLRALPAPAA